LPNINQALKYLISFIILALGGEVLAQKDNPQINQIRARFQIINNATDYKILSLTSDKYAEITGVYADGGIEAKGYIKNKKVFKIIETGFASFTKQTIEYYFWDNQLIFIYAKTEKAAYDSVSTALDFNQLTTISETRFYVKNSKLIKRVDHGLEEYNLEPGKLVGSLVTSPDKLKKWFLKMSK